MPVMHALQKARYVAGILFGPRGSAACLRRSASVAQVAARQGAELRRLLVEYGLSEREAYVMRHCLAMIHERLDSGFLTRQEAIAAMNELDVAPWVQTRILGDVK